MHEYKEEIGSRVTERGKLQVHHLHLSAASCCCSGWIRHKHVSSMTTSCFSHHREAGDGMKPPSDHIMVTLTHVEGSAAGNSACNSTSITSTSRVRLVNKHEVESVSAARGLWHVHMWPRPKFVETATANVFSCDSSSGLRHDVQQKTELIAADFMFSLAEQRGELQQRSR